MKRGLLKSSKKPPVSKVIDTNTNSNFIKGRKYDTDIDRLSRRSVQNELSTEQRKLSKELGGII